MNDLDALVESTPDDLSLSDALNPSLGSELASVPEDDQQVEEEASSQEEEDFDEESHSDTDDFEDEPRQATDAEAEPELEEVEWYGQRGKIDKRLSGYLNKYFTEKNQRLNEEHTNRVSEAQRKLQEAQERMEAAERLQAELQGHLDANPEFAESWNREMAIKSAKSEAEALREEFTQFRQSIEQERAEQAIRGQLAEYGEKYKLEDQAESELATKLALAEVALSNYATPLEHAYQNAVAQLNRRHRADKKQRLQSAAAKAAKLPKPTKSGKRSGGKVAKSKPKSLDELLEYHLSKPASFFER